MALIGEKLNAAMNAQNLVQYQLRLRVFTLTNEIGGEVFVG